MIKKSLLKVTCFLISFLCFSSLFFFLSSFVSADYQTARNDYVYQYSQYRDAMSQYQVTKSAYLTYGTITSQNNAIVAFRRVVQIRDRVISAYYDLLQEKLNTTEGIGSDYQGTFSSIKQNEKNWLADHQTKIDAAASLDDLNTVASQFEQHYSQFDHETKQAIGKVLLTKELNLRLETDATIASLSAKISDIRQSGLDTSLWDRGMITVNNKLDLSKQKFAAANNILFPPSGDPTEVININQGQGQLTQANQYLREALTYIMEIIKSITG